MMMMTIKSAFVLQFSPPKRLDLVHRYNYFANYTKVALTESIFSPKCTKSHLAAEFRPDPLRKPVSPHIPLSRGRGEEIAIKEQRRKERGEEGGRERKKERGWRAAQP